MGLAGMIGGAAYQGFRSKLNTVTLITAFVLSIFAIHNYRTCEDNKGYAKERGFAKFGYGISVTIIVLLCIIFALDIFFKVAKVSPI
jgi:hypothetical protein